MITAVPAQGREGDGDPDAFGVITAVPAQGREGDGDPDAFGVITAVPAQGREGDGDPDAFGVTASAQAPDHGVEGRPPADRTELAERPLVIVGPTASGKSDLAMGVARLIGGAEIVTLDSMQVYRGMDIGTATPTTAEQAEVPHHLIDLIEVSEEFAVAELQARARSVIGEIRDRGGVAVLVGGTGLYVRAVIDELQIPGRYPKVRGELEAESDTGALHRRLADLDPVAAGRMEPSNRRRIVRALEVTIGSGRPFSSYGPGLGHYRPTPFVQVGLRWDRDRLDDRIAARYQRQLADGFLDEVRALSVRPMSRTASQALGYGELLAHLRGEMTLDEALDLAVLRTRRFARRQDRWFRRDPRIRWLDAPPSSADIMCAWHAAVSQER